MTKANWEIDVVFAKWKFEWNVALERERQVFWDSKSDVKLCNSSKKKSDDKLHHNEAKQKNKRSYERDEKKKN